MAARELDVRDLARVRQGVARRTVHLGGAAQGVGVLHLAVVVEVVGDDLGPAMRRTRFGRSGAARGGAAAR